MIYEFKLTWICDLSVNSEYNHYNAHKHRIFISKEHTMDIVSYCLIMFLLFDNRDNTVGYYQFPQSGKLVFLFL